MSDKLAKYRCGRRVKVTVEGRTAEGYIRAVFAQFWHTKDLRRYRYDVCFPEPFWSCYILQVDEDMIEALP